jgi:hypothetical protein
MLENNALPRLNNNNFIFLVDGSTGHFAHIHDCLNENFPGGEPVAWPPRSPDLTPSDFFLWGCVKDQVYSQRVNTLGEVKAWITAVTENVIIIIIIIIIGVRLTSPGTAATSGLLYSPK